MILQDTGRTLKSKQGGGTYTICGNAIKHFAG